MKAGINVMICILIFVENNLEYDKIYDICVLLRTGSNPADIIGSEAILEKVL